MGKTIYLTESQFRDYVRFLVENVYVNNISNGKANLTYTKGVKRNKNTQNPFDYLKTDKMDEKNADTYEVTLKGGLVCYNITSIHGNEVMHYFKHLWDKKNKPATMRFKNVQTNQTEEYELQMLQSEENEFMKTFKEKVGFVVDYCIDKFKAKQPDIDISGISIYPVPSSSNFNITMANKLSESGLYDYPVQVINQNILLKNLKNLERDEEFIEKNKDYYQSKMYRKRSDDVTVDSYLNGTLNKLQALKKAQDNVDKINELVRDLLIRFNNYKISLKRVDSNNTRLVSNMANEYKKYCDLLYETLHITNYTNEYGENSKSHFNTIANTKAYSKGASIDKRSLAIWAVVKPYLRGEKSPLTGKPYTMQKIKYFDKTKFEIKDLTNGERMGLKNIYNVNDVDTELVQNELNKIKGTVFVIFDDNISGGATLSDICYQCKKIGIENIIPITFGEMNEKWVMNFVPLSSPEIINGHAKWNF